MQLIKPTLVIKTKGKVQLIWEGEDLLSACDGQVHELFKYLVERQGEELHTSELSAFMRYFPVQWGELCNAIDDTGMPRGQIYSIVLPEKTAESNAIFCLKKKDKSHYVLKVRTESPFVSIDTFQSQYSPAVGLAPKDRIEQAQSYLQCASIMRGNNYAKVRNNLNEVFCLLDENDPNPESLRLLIEAYSLRSVSFWLGDDGTGNTRPGQAWSDIESALRLSKTWEKVMQDAPLFQLGLLTHKAWLAADRSVVEPSEKEHWQSTAFTTLAEADQFCREAGESINRFDLFNTRGYVTSVFRYWNNAEECLMEARIGQENSGERYVSGMWAEVNNSALILQKGGTNVVSSARELLSHATSLLEKEKMLKGQTAAWNLDQLVKIAAAAKDWKLTAELMGAASASHRVVETALTPPERQIIDELKKLTQEHLSAETMSRHLNNGAALLSEDGGLQELLSRALSER